jgi:cold shock CspA family protein
MSDAKSSGGRKQGVCKWFNSKKGFGFITPKDGSEDIFVHQTAIHAEGFRSLAEQEPVEYETAVDEQGRVKALNVTGPNGAYVKGAPKPRQRFNNRSRRGGAGGGGRGGRGGQGGNKPTGNANAAPSN